MDKLFTIYYKYLGNIVAIMMILMIFNVFVDVILRYFFHTGSVAFQELQWHLFSMMFLFGIAYALNDDTHVRVDFLYENFTTKTKAYINIFGTLFFLIPFAILIVYNSYEFVSDSFSYSEISQDPGGLHYRWLIKGMIPLSFIVLIVSSIFYIYKNISILKGIK